MDEKFLSRETIKAAVSGEEWAIKKVIEHYSEYITKEATIEKKGPDGEVIKYVDEDLRQQMILGLIEALPNFTLDKE